MGGGALRRRGDHLATRAELAALAPSNSIDSVSATKAVFDGRNRLFTLRDCARAEAIDLDSIMIDGGTFLPFNASTI
jgi:hypothetical protein